MQASHSKTVDELEQRLRQQEIRHQAEIAERDDEINRIQQSAEETLEDLQKAALCEKETLLTKITLVFSQNST